MDGHRALHLLSEVAGVGLILFSALDVFLTVLYARVGSGIVSRRIASWLWYLFREGSKPFGRYRPTVLALCGPVIVVVAIGVWFTGIWVGSALLILPNLGTGIQGTNGPTPTDFFTALYIAGDCMTTVGTSDVSPRSPFFRVWFTVNSLIGMSLITLTITYILEIYNALLRRNTLALKVHLGTGETGDAAELIAGVGPRGQFSTGYSHIAEMAAEMLNFKESHHFYSVLLYFRFSNPHYAMSRVSLVNLDTVSLLKSALDDEEYGWLKESAAVNQLWRGTMHALTLLAVVFLPRGLPQQPAPPDGATIARWRERYFAGVRRLRHAGIHTIEDEELGAEIYVSLRARWDRYIVTFAEHMAHPMDSIDPIGTDPGSSDERRDHEANLHAVG